MRSFVAAQPQKNGVRVTIFAALISRCGLLFNLFYTAMKEIIQDLSYNSIQELIKELGEKPFRAKQLYGGLMQGK